MNVQVKNCLDLIRADVRFRVRVQTSYQCRSHVRRMVSVPVYDRIREHVWQQNVIRVLRSLGGNP